MDRFLQIILALCGLAISATMGIFGLQNEQSNLRNNQQQLIEQKLQSKSAWLEFYSQQSHLAVQECDQDMLNLTWHAVSELTRIDTELEEEYDALNKRTGILANLFPSTAENEAATIAPFVDEESRIDWWEAYEKVKLKVADCQEYALMEQVEQEFAVYAQQQMQMPLPPPSVPVRGSAPSEMVILEEPTTEAASEPVEELEISQEDYMQTLRVAQKNNNSIDWAQEQKAAKLPSVKGGDYYAVLASYKVGKEEKYARDRTALIESQIVAKGLDVDFRIYRTQQSNHYALVFASSHGSQRAARDLMVLARENGISPDSFVERDRNWAACPAPVWKAGADACPAP